jgi:hypothetical protein
LGDTLPKATIPNEMLATLRLSTLSITLEKTTMEEVANRLKGRLGGKGDAGESLQWLCFHGVDNALSWVLWLESGEINGGTVGSFQWQLVNKNAASDARCRMLGDAKLELPITARLGTSKAEVLRTLGPATLDEGDRLIYVHEHDETIQGEPFTSINIVTILLRGGQVWAIEASSARKR